MQTSNLVPFDGELYLFENVFSRSESEYFFKLLRNEIPWKQEGMKLFGKYIDFPRLTAWYADEGKSYTYSGLRNVPIPWTSFLFDLKQRTEGITNGLYNSVLLNYYRDGNDSMGWHCDNEPELGLNPIIASINFGAKRKIQFRHLTQNNYKLDLQLNNGSILLMKGAIQHHWQHQVPKQKKVLEARINLTFRKIF